MTTRLACGVLLISVSVAACGADTATRRLEAVTSRAMAVADWLGIDTETTPLSTSEVVASCPEGRGVSATAENVGAGRVDLAALEGFITAEFDDVSQAAYHAGIGHPHGLAWIVFDDGSRLSVIDAYGTVNTLSMIVTACHSAS